MGVGSMLARVGRYVVYERNPIVQVSFLGHACTCASPPLSLW